jgi:selenocysteine lyase/cysteine desulfurase
LEAPGFDQVCARASDLAERFATMLRDRGVAVAARGRSTLVSFEVPEPEAFAEQAADRGIVIRFLPGRPWVRASVGAWNSVEEIERLAELAGGAARR